VVRDPPTAQLTGSAGTSGSTRTANARTRHPHRHHSPHRVSPLPGQLPTGATRVAAWTNRVTRGRTPSPRPAIFLPTRTRTKRRPPPSAHGRAHPVPVAVPEADAGHHPASSNAPASVRPIAEPARHRHRRLHRHLHLHRAPTPSEPWVCCIRICANRPHTRGLLIVVSDAQSLPTRARVECARTRGLGSYHHPPTRQRLGVSITTNHGRAACVRARTSIGGNSVVHNLQLPMFASDARVARTCLPCARNLLRPAGASTV